MKSAYELAMERLEAKDPGVLLNEEQKQRIAEIEAKCKADIAAKELLLHRELAKAEAAGEITEIDQLRRQLTDEIRRLEDKREREKAEVRARS
ncbi:MAG: hypothetical protein WEC73_04210 [Chthoniobacterales bacterium]